jgi:hypothetical protein
LECKFGGIVNPPILADPANPSITRPKPENPPKLTFSMF